MYFFTYFIFVESKELEGAIGGMRDPSKRKEEEDSKEEDDPEDDSDDDDNEDGKDDEDQEGFMSMLQNFLMSKLDLGGHGEAEKVSQSACPGDPFLLMYNGTPQKTEVNI